MAVLAAGFALGAAPAMATTRYATTLGVNTGTCSTQGSACNVTRAFGQAVAGDTVSIGPGTYTVTATIDVTVRVDVVATSPASARPTIQSNTSSVVPLKLDNGSDGSTVTHLALVQQQANTIAVQVLHGATLTDVTVTSKATCVQAYGSETVRLDQVTALQNGSTSGYPCLQGSSTGPMTIKHSTVAAPIFTAIQLNSGSVDDSTVSGSVGLQIANPTSSARRDQISATSYGARLEDGALLADSLVSVSASGAATAVATSTTGTAENVTAVGVGAGAIGFEAITSGFPIDMTGSLTVHDSIVRAAEVDVKADPAPSSCSFPPCEPGTLHIDHSDFATTSGTIDDAGGNVHGDPLFASASDFHLQRGSPAIDAGLATTNTGTTDVAAAPRVVGAAVDMGAYEFQGGAPLVTTGVVTAVSATGATLNGTVDSGDLTTTATFAYGDSTAYGATIAGGSVAPAAGPAAVSAQLTGLQPAHTYHVRLSAANADGNVDGTDVTFTTPSTSTGAGTGTPPPTQTPTPTKTPTQPPTVAIPAVSRFAFAPARFSVRRGSHIGFSLSEPAAVRITFSRTLRGRRHGHACLASGRRHVPKPARCTRHVALKRELTPSGLAAGAHSIAFTAMLPRGSYRATIVATATGAARASTPVTTTFVVTR